MNIIRKSSDVVYLKPARASHAERAIVQLTNKRIMIHNYIVALKETVPKCVLEDYEETSSALSKYRKALVILEEYNTYQDSEGYFEPMDKIYDV